MKYYEVEVKCGHVGKNNYIIKKFYVRAESGKDAARFARSLPRVKHHHKDAIRNVIEISYEDYLLGRERNDLDSYFQATNVQEQRLECGTIDEEIIREEETKKYKKSKHIKRQLIELLTIKEWKSGRNYAYE